MKLASIIAAIVFFIMLVKGVLESGIWAILVLIFIVISNLKKKKKKTKKKYSTKKSKTTKKTKSKKENIDMPIFSDMKIDPSNYKSQYNSEPINQTEAYFKDKQKLSRIRQMKALANTNFSNLSKEERVSKLFYMQASFMEDFEDEYDINVPCNLQNPTFNDLNIYQLRSYFAWRTLIKNNQYHKTEDSYVLLYIYELINKIGIKNSIDGLNKIIEFWQKYRQHNNSIDSYLPLWVKNYYIINNIKIDYKLIEEEFPIKDKSNNIINEILIGNYENKLEYFDENSTYHILKSKIMEHKYSFLINMIIPEIFKNLDKHFSMNNYSFNEILFGRTTKTEWKPYYNAIYYNNPLDKDFQFNFNENEKYYKEKGYYYKEKIEKSEYSKYIMGYILKNIDISLRECLKINRSLKINENMLDIIEEKDKQLYIFLIDKKITDIINITIKKYLIENKTKINNIITDKKKKEIVIDLEKFDDIRQSSNRVQEKLIIEEEIQEELKNEIIKENIKEINEEYEKESSDIFSNLINSLNKIEIEFITKIIKSENRNNLIDYCKSNSVLYEIMIENINNKSLETIGDNLIEDYGEEIIIYAEYIDSIKARLGGC